MAPNVPTSETGTATAGINAARRSQEHEHDQDHQRDRDQQRALALAQRRADCGRAVDRHREVDATRSPSFRPSSTFRTETYGGWLFAIRLVRQREVNCLQNEHSPNNADCE